MLAVEGLSTIKWGGGYWSKWLPFLWDGGSWEGEGMILLGLWIVSFHRWSNGESIDWWGYMFGKR